MVFVLLSLIMGQKKYELNEEEDLLKEKEK